MAQAGQQAGKVVVGLGATGLSCARWLAARGEAFSVVDSRPEPPGLARLREELPGVPVVLGEFPEPLLAGAEALVLSPGVDPRHPAIRRAAAAGVPVTGDIDIFARQVSAPIAAVTGSNAKSTVVSLLGAMAREAGLDVAVAGNIGTPVLDLLLDRPEPELWVLELSSFQLETTHDLGAEVATVLNVSADHLDRYDSLQAYHRAKHRIFQACRQAVVNRDDPLSEPLLPAAVKRGSFGLSRPDMGQFGCLGESGEEVLYHHREPLLRASEMKLAGRHNIANALAALALGRALGLPFGPMVEALKAFPGLPHRCQWVAEERGVQFYNDSKGTNVGATLAALEGLGGKGPLILLAGGVGKGADFRPLAPALARHARLAILFGEDAGAIEAAVSGSVDVRRAADLDAAVRLARAEAMPGDLVLLSPACASFDMFRNYEHRGEAFMAAVRSLVA